MRGVGAETNSDEALSAAANREAFSKAAFAERGASPSEASEPFSADVLLPLMTGLLEKAVNQALRQDAEALTALSAYSGRVIRVKTYQPYCVVFCQFCDEGVSLLTQYDGDVDARIQAPAGKLLMTLLQQDAQVNRHDFELKVLGDRAFVEDVLDVLQRYDVWRWVRQLWLEWFPGSVDLPSFLERLNLQAPEWVHAFQALPSVSADVLVELKHLSETQSAMLSELCALRAAEERRSSAAWQRFVGGVLVVVGLAWLARDALAPLW